LQGSEIAPIHVEELGRRCQDLDGKVAWITGSSRGIGAAVAQLFAQRGAHVAVHGRDRQALADVRAEVERAGGRAICVEADVTNGC